MKCKHGPRGGERRRRQLTGKDLMDQTISLFSGTHLTLPTVVLNLGESASVGTGMWISTLLAVERLLNWLLAWEEKQAGRVEHDGPPERGTDAALSDSYRDSWSRDRPTLRWNMQPRSFLVISQCLVCILISSSDCNSNTGSTLIMYSIRLWECFSMTDSIQIRGFTCHMKQQKVISHWWHKSTLAFIKQPWVETLSLNERNRAACDTVAT